MAKPPLKKTYTSGEVARLLGINPRTARLYLTQGRIRGQQNPVTGTWAVDHQALMDFLREKQIAPSEIEFPVKVLIVDDDEAVIRSIGDTLRRSRWNFDIDQCTDGYQALIRVGVNPPDVILLDSRMPNMDGRQVLKALRAEMKNTSTKVLAITGFEEDLDELLGLGADAALAKPFDPDVLTERVVSLIPRTKQKLEAHRT